jgi:hypothetical protein
VRVTQRFSLSGQQRAVTDDRVVMGLPETEGEIDSGVPRLSGHPFTTPTNPLPSFAIVV